MWIWEFLFKDIVQPNKSKTSRRYNREGSSFSQ
jgi:hypothetical protein